MDSFYNSNEMVKMGCGHCEGCSACCQDMGQSIVLTPYDVYQLTTHLNRSFEELMTAGEVVLHVEDGLILPNIKMTGQVQKPQCSFLNEEGRCSIHDFRPGLCRLFPLGRDYRDGTFQYFLVENACVKDREAKSAQKSKVKISNWLNESALKKNEAFITEWHYFIREVQGILNSLEDGDGKAKAINMAVLQNVYMLPYNSQQDFYEQFEARKYAISEAIK